MNNTSRLEQYWLWQLGFAWWVACLAGLTSNCNAQSQPVQPAQSNPTETLVSRPNVLLICIDDLRPELNCYGASHIISPNLDSLASDSTTYLGHYVQAPTCGASRYALLTGCYGPANNDALFRRAARIKDNQRVPVSMPEWFRKNGYTTVSIGKVSHHPGGSGGADWDDEQQLEMPDAWDRCYQPSGQWKHPRGWMHGLAQGEIRSAPAKMNVIQHADVDDSDYPDGITVPQAIEELQAFAQDDKPFFLAVGLLRPHLPFGAPARDFHLYDETRFPPIQHPQKPEGTTTWHRSDEFKQYQRWGRDPNQDAEFALEIRRHYAACVTFADRQVGKLLKELERQSLDQNTIVIVWGDHGWHLGEHAIWGKHSLFEESLRSPLIVHAPSGSKATRQSLAQRNASVTETIDVFPTICRLCGIPSPDRLDGKMLPGLMLADTSSELQQDAERLCAISYFGGARTIRTHRYRLVEHQTGFLELYDHLSDQGENKNLAESQPETAQRLLSQLTKRWAETHLNE